MEPKRPNKDDVIKTLQQLRQSLVHALSQRNIGAKRFNEIREQLLPLDQQLRNLGVDVDTVAQMQPAYVMLTRHQRRERQRASKHPAYEQRLRERMKVTE